MNAEVRGRVRQEVGLRREVVVGFAAAFLSMAVLAWFAATEWPGSPHHCAVVYRDALPTDRDVLPHECFCENFDRGALRGHNDGIRQAANTLSNRSSATGFAVFRTSRPNLRLSRTVICGQRA